MESGNTIESLIKKTALRATNLVAENYQGAVLNSLAVTVDKENGIVGFYDPEENGIESVIIDEWIGKPNLSDNTIIAVLRRVAQDIEKQGGFEVLELYKPFNINYTDENMVVIQKLATVEDENTIESDNSFLEKMDRDFDVFLDKLLKE